MTRLTHRTGHTSWEDAQQRCLDNGDARLATIATAAQQVIAKYTGSMEGPIDLRPTRLNCILQDLFRDTPLDHIWRAQICSKNAYLATFAIFGIFAYLLSILDPFGPF